MQCEHDDGRLSSPTGACLPSATGRAMVGAVGGYALGYTAVQPHLQATRPTESCAAPPT